MDILKNELGDILNDSKHSLNDSLHPPKVSVKEYIKREDPIK